jgi:hypothetical protein
MCRMRKQVRYRLVRKYMPSLTRWILEFGFQVNISLECRPFGELNKSNRIQLCGFLKKWSSRSGPSNPFTIPLGWSMIREWSSDFSGTRERMLAKLQVDYRHSLPNIPISFEQSDSRLRRYGAAVKICTTKFPAEDLLSTILTAHFWQLRRYRHLNHLIRSLRDCLLRNRQCYGIYRNQLDSNRSICIGCRICWAVIFPKMKGGCKKYIAILACCQTWWLASSCD